MGKKGFVTKSTVNKTIKATESISANIENKVITVGFMIYWPCCCLETVSVMYYKVKVRF